ncbi:MAG: DUF4352 domain-containing protein [Bryobacteraceae bacterium]|nr:DUF4352 domain-containing protein [Bryobacteraceae bacterium]
MIKRYKPFHSIALAAAILLGGCGSKQQGRLSFRMGERMQVGPLIYNVLEARWTAQLGGTFDARIPENRFLLLRLTVTNSGGKEAGMPLLSLEDGKGNSFQELQDGRGVEGWFGLLRSLRPAQTDEGWIVFDVPTNSYQLRISDTVGDTEQSVLIDIPLNLDSLNESVPTTLPGGDPTALPVPTPGGK